MDYKNAIEAFQELVNVAEKKGKNTIALYAKSHSYKNTHSLIADQIEEIRLDTLWAQFVPLVLNGKCILMLAESRTFSSEHGYTNDEWLLKIDEIKIIIPLLLKLSIKVSQMPKHLLLQASTYKKNWVMMVIRNMI
ncbi:MAG: hypothetical protein FWC71_05290 [Defluviitaleaceae bacterium]|nr:hypothetical protein [Defluviitaleaceae bacterium]